MKQLAAAIMFCWAIGYFAFGYLQYQQVDDPEKQLVKLLMEQWEQDLRKKINADVVLKDLGKSERLVILPSRSIYEMQEEAGIAKDVSVAGDFTFVADLTWLGSSGSWRQGIFVNFGSQSFLIHDSGEAGWYIYGPGGVLFAGNAGGTSGQSGTTTLSIERSGDTLTFGFTRGGTFTTLFTTTQTGLGTLTQVGLAAWSHGIDLNAFADNASLIVD